jgi:hypothetical protein
MKGKKTLKTIKNIFQASGHKTSIITLVSPFCNIIDYIERYLGKSDDNNYLVTGKVGY